jgi:uncharacterized protein (UPF0548 family)
MFRFSEPETAAIRDFINDRQFLNYSYPEEGATRDGGRPAGYAVDRNRIQLGTGGEVFERAKKAVRDWRMFSLEWVKLCWPFKKIQPGVMVAVVAQHFGFWSVHAARIVYVIDEPRRFGFAYGTLGDHAEKGEERFLVEWREDDSVWYEISSFSRPNHWLVWLAYPITRSLQARFARESLRAMISAMLEAQQQGRERPA